MKDFLRQTLEVGDTVILVVPGYRSLTKGKIVRFTKRYVFINFGNPWPGSAVGGEIKQEPQQIVKIPLPEVN